MVEHADARIANQLEPGSLLAAFRAHPPEGFECVDMTAGNAILGGFVTRFDLTTSLDKPVRDRMLRLPLVRHAKALWHKRTLFVGTTVSEYLVHPERLRPAELVAAALRTQREHKAQLVIFKDVPCDSPLLSPTENAAAAHLLDECRRSGFLIVEGQALAYVPIDFDSVETYLGRLSKTRRKDLKKKLVHRDAIAVEVVTGGDARLSDPAFRAELYGLYEQVYAQSEVHFDRLTSAFFAALWEGRDPALRLFVYRREGRLIGWNLCFVVGSTLVDKYVGFRYPDARESCLYFVSWFENLSYALAHGLRHYVAGWTDPEVKKALGARFTLTKHAVRFRNPALRMLLAPWKKHFEPDAAFAARAEAAQ